MPLPLRIGRFNRLVTNRLTQPLADHLPGFGIVSHRGRRSGRTYRTPVNVFRTGDDYIIALTYGPQADWVRNVLAAGGCELFTRGRPIPLTCPCLVTDPRMRWAQLPVRLVLGAIGADQYLRLSRAPTARGAPR